MHFPLLTGSHLLALIALALATAIFIIDTFTPLGIAVVALYAIVVVLAARVMSRAGGRQARPRSIASSVAVRNLLRADFL